MRRKIRRELMKHFPLQFEKKFPQFNRQKIVGGGESPKWIWSISPGLTFFVMLQPFEKKDQFVLEIAWNDIDEFPYGHIIPDKLLADSPKYRIRLAELWATQKWADVWAIIPDETNEERKQRIAALVAGDSKRWLAEIPEEQVIDRVAPLVHDAIEKLAQYGMPLFKSVAERRGIPWPHE